MDCFQLVEKNAQKIFTASVEPVDRHSLLGLVISLQTLDKLAHANTAERDAGDDLTQKGSSGEQGARAACFIADDSEKYLLSISTIPRVSFGLQRALAPCPKGFLAP